MFTYQYNIGKHSRINLMDVRENPIGETLHFTYIDFQQLEEWSNFNIIASFHSFIDIHPMILPDIRGWKFKYYDSNGDGKLKHSELQSLHTEIYNLIGTKSFQVQLEQLLDSDSNYTVSKQEWDNYFTLSGN